MPTTLPSYIPSSSPSHDPCKAYDNNYGNTSNTEASIVFYKYKLETNDEIADILGASLSEQITTVEDKLLNLLVSHFFPCNRTSASASLNNKRRQKDTLDWDSQIRDRSEKDPIHHQFSALVGISSRPFDAATGETCDVQDSSEPRSCNVIGGRLSLFLLSNLEQSSDLQNVTMSAIKSIMDKGSLDSSHPAIVSVVFTDSTLGILQEDKSIRGDADDDNEDVNTVSLLGINGATWIIMGSGMIMAVGIFVVTRYRYYATSGQSVITNPRANAGIVLSDNDSSNAFIDITSFDFRLDDDEHEENFIHKWTSGQES